MDIKLFAEIEKVVAGVREGRIKPVVTIGLSPTIHRDDLILGVAQLILALEIADARAEIEGTLEAERVAHPAPAKGDVVMLPDEV